MKLAYRSFYALCIMFTLLYGCAQLGVPTPTTLNERAAVALTTVTAVRTTATALLQAKKLTAADGANILTTTDNARSGIDIARNLGPTQGMDRLQAVQTALQALQAYLATKQGD